MAEKTSAPCPRCGKALTKGAFLEVPAGCCDGCRGVWLDSSELKTVLKDRTAFTEEELRTIGVIRGRAVLATGGGALACPACSGSMDQFHYPRTTITIHRCERHGTWLDEGELERVRFAAERLAGSSASLAQGVAQLFGIVAVLR